jgi:hypothetical protein
MTEFCPHCGGSLRHQAEPLRAPCFDDERRAVMVAGEPPRHVSRGEWAMLTAMRQRYRRWISADHLAPLSCWRAEEGGSVPAVRVRIACLRRILVGTPFAIATEYGVGYGLFPRSEIS